MPTPIIGAPQLASAQATPETTVNEQVRYLEAFASLAVLKDRDLATPPASPNDGDRYLVAASPTGAWTGHAGDIAFFMNTAWEFVTAFEGLFAWVVDEAVLVRYHSAAWATLTTPSQTAAINAQSGTSYTLAISDAEGVLQLTNAGAVTLTVPPNSSVAFPIGTVIELHQGGAGTVTVSAGVGVTVASRGSVFDLAGQDAIAALRKVSTNTWRLFGDIA